MKEQQIAYAIRQELDQATQVLPDHVTRRLHQARTAALAGLDADQPTTAVTADPDRPAFWTRFAMTAVPVAFVAVGLFGIAQWADGEHHEMFAQELAALDEAVLLGKLPIDAYTDKGFAVFLENTRQ